MAARAVPFGIDASDPEGNSPMTRARRWPSMPRISEPRFRSRISKVASAVPSLVTVMVWLVVSPSWTVASTDAGSTVRCPEPSSKSWRTTASATTSTVTVVSP